MTLPEKRKPSNSSADVRLEHIEVQTSYIAKTLDSFIDQYQESEKSRMDNWVEYKVEHAKIVDTASELSKKVFGIEEDAIRVEKITNEKIEKISGCINDLKDKINPLIAAHKILVWVAIVLGSSVAGLLWAILTHTVTLNFNP